MQFGYTMSDCQTFNLKFRWLILPAMPVRTRFVTCSYLVQYSYEQERTDSNSHHSRRRQYQTIRQYQIFPNWLLKLIVNQELSKHEDDEMAVNSPSDTRRQVSAICVDFRSWNRL